MTKNNQSSGFTLVELAIVMIIIGLLIGGVLKGQELVNNARVTSTVKLIKSVEASALGFKDRYGVLPGDALATKIPGCNAGNNCFGGNEDGGIGAPLGTDAFDGTPIWWTTRITSNGPEGRETYMAWKHLALSGFISGIDTAATIEDAEWGVTHPKTPFGGGLELFYDGFTTIGFSGHLVRFSRNGVGAGGNVEGEITPSQAFSIDRKLDDGHSDQGLVFADYGVTNNDCKANGAYIENNDSVCMLFIAMFK